MIACHKAYVLLTELIVFLCVCRYSLLLRVVHVGISMIVNGRYHTYEAELHC